MRAVKMILIGLLVFFWLVPAGFAQQDGDKGSDLFIGGNLGLGVPTGASDDTDLESSGFLYGITGKIFFNKFGIGGTYNVSSYDSEDDSTLDFESELSTATFDVMFDFSKDENQRFYISGSIGSATEELSGEWNAEFDTDVLGIGVGGYSKTNDFSFGGDIRYLSLSDFENAGGIVEAYFTLGFSVTDL